MSDYELKDQGSVTGPENVSSSLSIQTGAAAHASSYTVGNGESFPLGGGGGDKLTPKHDADHSPPFSANVK
jgi:hypothetical protein